MLTDKNYCDYETCVALKKVGFNEYCSGYIDSLCKTFIETRYLKKWNSTKHSDFEVFSCPSLYEAQKWLREEHDICVHICRPHMTNGSYVWSNMVFLHGCEVSSRGFFLSYEEALLEGIKKSIKILKDK